MLTEPIGAGYTDTDPAAETRYADEWDWFTEWASPRFARPDDQDTRWCPQWRKHPEAWTIIEALWRSWEAAAEDPADGMAQWLVMRAYPLLDRLWGPGPFKGCDRHGHHTPPKAVPLATTED